MLPLLSGILVCVIRVHDVLEALADKLTGGVAGDLTQRMVDEHPVTVPVEQPRPDRSPLEDLLEVILGPVCKLLWIPGAR